MHMHTLSIFPQLFTYGLIAPFLLRLAVGGLRLFVGIEKWKKDKTLSVLNIVSSLCLIAGLYTQVAVIVGIILISIDYFSEKKAGTLTKEKTVISILMKVVLLSLLFTGPGFLAFDLPL
jgi:uncharacterized membrane protein YphA (DoxX/SURF4 family)